MYSEAHVDSQVLSVKASQRHSETSRDWDQSWDQSDVGDTTDVYGKRDQRLISQSPTGDLEIVAAMSDDCCRFATDSPWRTYGSYQWRARFPGHPPSGETKKLYSPVFELCGYRWRLFLRLTGLTDDEEQFSLYLQSTDKCPAKPVDFQLWLANHADVGKCIHREFSTTFSSSAVDFGHCGFLPKSITLRKSKGFVKDRCMAISVNISVRNASKSQATEHLQALYTNPILHAFSSGIETLYDNAHLSDIVLKAGETRICAHKVILAAQSPAFKAMFQSGMREASADTVELPETEGHVLQALVQAMYQKNFTIPPGVLLPLFVIADAYQVLAVRNVCIEQLLDSITAENVLERFESADACTAKDLKQACTDFIAQTGNRVAVSSDISGKIETLRVFYTIL